MTRETKVTTQRLEERTLVVQFRVLRVNEFGLAEELNREFRALAERQDFDRLVIDCANLDYVISEALCTWLQAAHRLKERGVQVVACNLNPFLKDVCKTMRLDVVIPIYSCLEDALRG